MVKICLKGIATSDNASSGGCVVISGFDLIVFIPFVSCGLCTPGESSLPFPTKNNMVPQFLRAPPCPWM